MQKNSNRFNFDGGAATYVGTALLGLIITIATLGLCYPFAVVLRERWRAKHSYIDGKQLVFTGSAWGLFGNWVKWLLLSIITCGIYLLWVGPRIQKWIWVNTDFALTSGGSSLGADGSFVRPVPPSRRDELDAPPIRPIPPGKREKLEE